MDNRFRKHGVPLFDRETPRDTSLTILRHVHGFRPLEAATAAVPGRGALGSLVSLSFL